MVGQDITKEYETAKDYVREKFEEDPDLANSDTELVFRMIEDALGIVLPFEKTEMPSVGTITRASRELRNEEGYNELVDDEVEEDRKQADESMTQHMAGTSKAQTEDSQVLWSGSDK